MRDDKGAMLKDNGEESAELTALRSQLATVSAENERLSEKVAELEEANYNDQQMLESETGLKAWPTLVAQWSEQKQQLATLTREREEWESRRDRLLIDLGMSAKLLAAAEHRAESAEQRCTQLEAALKQLLDYERPVVLRDNAAKRWADAARALAGKEMK